METQKLFIIIINFKIIWILHFLIFYIYIWFLDHSKLFIIINFNCLRGDVDSKRMRQDGFELSSD